MAGENSGDAPSNPLDLLTHRVKVPTYGGTTSFDESVGRYAFGPNFTRVANVETATNPVDGTEYPVVTASVMVPNWDGGARNIYDRYGTLVVPREQVDSDAKKAASDAGTALYWLSIATKLSAFGVSEISKREYADSIRGARDKIQSSQSDLEQINANASALSQQIPAVDSQIDALRNEVEAGKLLLAQLRGTADAILASYDAVLSDLLKAIERVKDAERAVEFAKNRNNFPAGVQGAKQWQTAQREANARLASAKQEETRLGAEANSKYTEHSNIVTEYNNLAMPLQNQAQSVLNLQSQQAQMIANYRQILKSADGPIAQRGEGIRDAVAAQNQFSSRMEISFALAQSAVGLRGASDTLKHIGAGQYYMAGGAMLGAGVAIGGAYFPELVPYQTLISKIIISGANNLEKGGSWLDFGMDLGEATIGYRSAQGMVEAIFASADRLNIAWGRADVYQEYDAYNTLIQQTGVGLRILGTATETFGGVVLPGVPVGAAVKPATVVAENSLEGVLQAGVSLGYLSSKGRGFSAQLGTRQLSGTSLVLFSPFAIPTGIINSVFNGAGAAELVREMAEVGIGPEDLRPGTMTLRPTIPDTPAFGPPAITEEPIKVAE